MNLPTPSSNCSGVISFIVCCCYCDVCLFCRASDGYLYIYNRDICDRTLKVCIMCGIIIPTLYMYMYMYKIPAQKPSALIPVQGSSSVFFLITVSIALLHTGYYVVYAFPTLCSTSPATTRLMPTRMMQMLWHSLTSPLRSYSLRGTMACARCGTAAPSLSHTRALWAASLATETVSPSLIPRYAHMQRQSVKQYSALDAR